MILKCTYSVYDHLSCLHHHIHKLATMTWDIRVWSVVVVGVLVPVLVLFMCVHLTGVKGISV